MRDGINDTTESAVAQVAALLPGESYCKAQFIPAHRVDPEKIRLTKRRLLSALTPVISRAKKTVSANYRIISFHNMARDCSVVVAAVIVRDEEDFGL